ncbi:MAG: response regulator transcription factor [Deltaproteobacteria bacterium]|nr:response regulator transcription factor [Deltaproteobacteria bacterium]
MKRRILLVEDEVNLARGLKLNFELEGYEVEWVATGAAARASWMQVPPALVVLDLMLPDADGLDLLQEIKRLDIRLPVLVLTARVGDEDRINGLSLGADDYVTKPFNLQELVLRVRGMLKRSDWYRDELPGEIRIGEATLATQTSMLSRAGTSHLLTELELALLLHLWSKRGTWVSRDELLVQVWGYTPETMTRTVDIFISRLRRMLGDSGSAPKLLLTKRGRGYMIAGTP